MVSLMQRRREMMQAHGSPGSDIPIGVNLLDSSETGYRATRALNISTNSNAYSGNTYISNYLPVNDTDVFQGYSIRLNAGIHFYDENKTFMTAVSSGPTGGIHYFYRSGLDSSTPATVIPSGAAFMRFSGDGSNMGADHYYKRIR